MASTFQYPAVVSRTLSVDGKSLRTIVCMHDRQITDADLNAVQDLQDLKLRNILNDMVSSGYLTYSPMNFSPFNPNTFFVPAFDVLFNGTVVTVAGNQSSDLGVNRVTVPSPAFWAPGSLDEDARLYVVFLELWYQALNPITGTGYYIDPLNTSLRYYFAFGGVQPDPSTANATANLDDSVDPFQGLFTTERAQIQWRVNVQRVALTYDFSRFRFGLDPGASTAETVYAQASRPTVTPGISPLNGINTFQFTNMAGITGDSGLWRAGDGNVNNSLGTMDGYSYAMPLVVAFQRNTGNFDIVNNLFGCALASKPNSGTLTTLVSGRFDNKLADQVFADDAVDTRSIVQLQGTDLDLAVRLGFGDLVLGKSKLALSRGESPGNRPEAFGSTLEYNVAMSRTVIPNTSTVGQWDGFSNGFSSDQRTFFSTAQITTAQKSTGIANTNWVLNDSFTITLPNISIGKITAVEVAALVNNIQTGTKTPAALLQGQVQFTGLGSKAVTVTFVSNLSGSAFDPGPNNLYVTVGVTYPAGSGIDLRKTPFNLDGGLLTDQDAGATIPVFGISEYSVQSPQVALTTSNQINGQPVRVSNMWAINPEYSDILLGTKIWIQVLGSAGVQQTISGATVTSFTIPCANLNGSMGGLYVTKAWDLATGNFYLVFSRSMSAAGPGGTIQTIVTLQGAVDPSSTVVFSLLAQNTAQLAFNGPVKGVTQIEETVLFGNYTANSNFPMDPRVVVENISFNAVTNTNTIVLGAKGCQIKGISGDDTNRFIWVLDNTNTLVALQVISANFGGGTVTVTVPGTVILTGQGAQPFLFCGSILPAFNPQSTLIVGLQYVPYQGEGVLNRDYEILHAEDNALITTNGTGAAPVIGLADVYPYNRELPIVLMLPAQLSWNDATLENDAVSTLFDSNFVAMRVSNVEHTFLAPLHTNDFVPPLNKDTRKTIRFTSRGQRGFATAVPHIGFAIAPPSARTVLGQNLQSTIAPITLFVDNVNGDDNNTGLSLLTAKKTIGVALSLLPPVLRHPCVVILRDTGTPFSITNLQSSLDVIALGDGDIRSAKYHALGNLSRVIHDEGRLVISRESTATNPVVIDATGFSGFGDGPTVAFYTDTSRVILNGLQFKGFQNPAITAYNADIDFVDCQWVGNVQAGAYVGCDTVIFDRGSISVPDNGTGHVATQSNVTSSDHALIAIGTAPGVFYTVTRNSTLNLSQHGTGTLDETNIAPQTVVAQAQLNSNISVSPDFQTNGSAVLQAISVLSRTVSVTPFAGGVTTDPSSSVVTQVG
jgi:hypothetical protein